MKKAYEEWADIFFDRRKEEDKATKAYLNNKLLELVLDACRCRCHYFDDRFKKIQLKFEGKIEDDYFWEDTYHNVRIVTVRCSDSYRSGKYNIALINDGLVDGDQDFLSRSAVEIGELVEFVMLNFIRYGSTIGDVAYHTPQWRNNEVTT